MTREVVGTYMNEAWRGPALDNDAGMNMRLDYDELAAPEQEYLSAVKEDMKFRRVAWVGLRKPH
jgi:hypothetical protein